MKCPQCGTRNPLGSESCSNCGRAFTRSRIQAPRPATNPYPESEQTRQFPAGQVPRELAPAQGRPDVHVHVARDDYYDDYDDGYAYREPLPRSRGLSCLPVLALLLVLAIVLVIAAILVTNLILRPRVENAISTNVGAGIETVVSEQVNAGLPDLPTGAEGEITISEADINQRIAEQGNLGPIGNVDVNVVPNGFEADMHAYGVDGGFASDVSAENGQIRLSNSSVSGPLQYLVSAGDIERITSDAINRSLAESGYHVKAVTLQDGQLVLSLMR